MNLVHTDEVSYVWFSWFKARALTPHVHTIFISSGGDIRAPVSPLQHWGLRPCRMHVSYHFTLVCDNRRYRFRGRLKSIAIRKGRDISSWRSDDWWIFHPLRANAVSYLVNWWHLLSNYEALHLCLRVAYIAWTDWRHHGAILLEYHQSQRMLSPHYTIWWSCREYLGTYSQIIYYIIR